MKAFRMKAFRENDRLNVRGLENNFKDKEFIEAVEILGLEEDEKRWIQKWGKEKIVKWYKEIEAGDLLDVVDEKMDTQVSEYIRKFLDVEFIDAESRVLVLMDFARVETNIHELMEGVKRLGDLYQDLILKDVSSRRNFDLAVKVIHSVVSLDQSILWRMFQEVQVRTLRDRSNNFKEALDFLPNMAFRLRKDPDKEDSNEEYKVEYLEGNLMDTLGIKSHKWKGKGLNVLFDNQLRDKIIVYINASLINKIAEFHVVRDDRVLRTVIKSFKGDDGVIRVNGYTTDVTELAHLEEKMKEMAYYDPLTKLPNREFFNKKLDDLVEEREGEDQLALMFIDIDDFKSVNDTYGHGAGDKLLIELAKRLQKSVRDGDIVSRRSGDEFTIICNKVKAEQDLEVIVNRLISNVADTPFDVGGKMIDVTLSVGIAVHPKDGKNPGTLIEHADTAMYKAKNEGKNRYCFFNESLNTDKRSFLRTENELRKALIREEFVVNYQLQYNTESKEIVGMEALVRWEHPERGLVSPGEFIQVAEKSGLIFELGPWVLEEACKKMKALVDMGYDSLVMGVNFSARQFSQKDLASQVQDILVKTGLPPKNLMVEITESTSMENVKETATILSSLKEMGVLISIDDFGTGYSSLNYLQEFPLHNLKIDRSFIIDIAVDSKSQALVRSFISFAENMELDVVAEGVEEVDQVEKLVELKCEKFQGYYFGKPVTFEVLVELLDKGVGVSYE